MVKVSVIVTCRKDTDLRQLLASLNDQTFKDFEVVITHDKTEAEGWNTGIKQAIGDILVFTESDCIPIYKTWLKELIKEVEDGKIIKGSEVRETSLSPANVAITRRTLGEERFNKDFYPAADSEFFRRLMSKGTGVKELDKAVVYHKKKHNIKRELAFSFLYGAKWVRIYYRHAVMRSSKPEIPKSRVGYPLSRILKSALSYHLVLIIQGILGLIGTIYGSIRYLPEIRYRKRYKEKRY